MYDAHGKLFGTLAFLAPVLALPLLQGTFALPFSTYVIVALISSYPLYYWFSAHYSYYLAPFMFIALAEILSRLENGTKERLARTLVIIGLLAFFLTIACLASAGNVPETEHSQKLREVLRQVPGNASIATQNDIFPHVAMRLNAYTIASWGGRYLGSIPLDVDYMLVDNRLRTWGVKCSRDLTPIVREVVSKGTHGILLHDEGITLLKRDYRGPPKPLKVDNVYEPEDLCIERGSRILLNGEEVIAYRDDVPGTIWFGPYDLLPMGKYEVTYVMKVEGEPTALILDVYSHINKRTYATWRLDENLTRGDWVSLSFRFDTKTTIPDVEFRGIASSDDVNVYLRKIIVKNEDSFRASL